MSEPEPDNTQNSLNISITSPSSPLVPLHIHDFIKEIDVPIQTKVNMITPTITGGSETTTNTGFIGYFKSFFQQFSQSSKQQKKQEAQDQSTFQKLFYSGEGISSKKEEEPKQEEEEEEEEEENIIKENIITKIIISTKEDPEIVLRESLKGTKLYYFTERTKLPSQWV